VGGPGSGPRKKGSTPHKPAFEIIGAQTVPSHDPEKPNHGRCGDLLSFAKWLYPTYPIIDHIHKPLCDSYQRSLEHVLKWRGKRGSGETQRISLCLMPRWSLKTTLGVHAFATYAMTIEPNIRILFGSKTEDLSKKSLGVIKRIVEGNKEYIARYGERKPRQGDSDLRLVWTATGFTIGDRTDHHPKEQTVEIVGMSNVDPGYHYDLIILDDPHGRATGDEISKTWDAMRDLVWLLEPWGALLVTMTRWDVYDVAQRMMNDWASSLSETPLIMRADDGLGNPLMPELYTREKLQEIRAKMTAYEYAGQMMLEPFAAEDQRFAEAYYREQDVDPRDAEWIAVTVDPGSGSLSDESESAIVVGGWLKGGFYHQFDCESGCWSDTELYDKIIFHLKKWRADRLGVEKSSLSTFLRLPLETRLRSLRPGVDKYPAVEDFLSTGEKNTGRYTRNGRIRSWIDEYVMGKCSFSPHMTDKTKFRTELFSFPSTKKVDLLVAWEGQRQLAFKRVPSDRMRIRTPEEQQDLRMQAVWDKLVAGDVEDLPWVGRKEDAWTRL